MIVLVEAILVMLVAGAVVVAIVKAWSAAQRDSTTLTHGERAELARLTDLVEDLKELAWDHREIDPDLATILIEKIRASERSRRELP